MQHVPVTRAAHLIEFCDIFRHIGLPVETRLRESKLPEFLEETPESVINNILATGFVGISAAREGINDVGWLAARAFSQSQLSAEVNAAVAAEPTVFARLKRFFQLAALEDSHLRLDMTAIGPTVCVRSDMDIPEDTPGMSASNWTQIAVVLDVIRSVTGRAWTPSKITFETEFDLCWEAKQAFANTRIETGAAHTAIFFPREVLSRRAAVVAMSGSTPDVPLQQRGNLDDIKALLSPYLTGTLPSVADAAEISGLSLRTFQRRLGGFDTNYRELVDKMRFDIAVDRLASTDAPVIEIAADLGFADQSNFGRMFRRYAGTSPGAYRKAYIGS